MEMDEITHGTRLVRGNVGYVVREVLERVLKN